MRFLIKVMPLGGEHGHITLLYNWISFVNNFTLRYISSYFFLELTPHVELTPRVADGGDGSGADFLTFPFFVLSMLLLPLLS